jgi:protein AbiQ
MRWVIMQKIRFYKIDLNYVKYLWKFDNKVQYDIYKSDDYNKKRPYIGVVLEINDFRYFAPLEHPRISHRKLKSNPHILKINNGRHGLIAFNNMIPVKESQLINFDFKDEDANYQEILRSQFIFCDNNKERINKHAQNTYNKVVIKKDPFFISICCNFKLLEEKCLKYIEPAKQYIAVSNETEHRNIEK